MTNHALFSTTSSVHRAVKGNTLGCTSDICILWRTNYESASLKTIIRLNMWTWQCMWYAQCTLLLGQWIWMNLILGEPQNHSIVWRIQVEFGVCPKHRCQTSSSEIDRMCTCNNWCHYARVGGVPQYELVKAASKGVLNISNSLHHLSLIVDQGWGDWIEKELCDSLISSRNGGRATSHTSTSERSFDYYSKSAIS